MSPDIDIKEFFIGILPEHEKTSVNVDVIVPACVLK
jgi:hypothetical protein